MTFPGHILWANCTRTKRQDAAPGPIAPLECYGLVQRGRTTILIGGRPTMRFTFSIARLARAGTTVMALAAFSMGAQADSPREGICGSVDYNAMILDIIKGMPVGGGYSLNSRTLELPTTTVHNIGGGKWEMRVYDGTPSHCTSATYTVFLHLVAELQNTGAIHLTQQQLDSLAAGDKLPDGSSRVDGEGPFAIFNSNGAGAAALLMHTGTGFSFRDDKLGYARPGDLLKIFWNEGVGANEQGHQVIYMGERTVAGRDMVCFWSSQRQHKKKRDGRREALYFAASDNGKVHEGYGEVCRPRTDIKAMVFSRITCMKHLPAGLADMARRSGTNAGTADQFVDEYLRSLRTVSSDHITLNRKYDIVAAPSPATYADSGIAPLH